MPPGKRYSPEEVAQVALASNTATGVAERENTKTVTITIHVPAWVNYVACGAAGETQFFRDEPVANQYGCFDSDGPACRLWLESPTSHMLDAPLLQEPVWPAPITKV